MEEIKVGEYVRTKDGYIDKVVIDYKGKCNNPNCDRKHISCKENYYDIADIVKHSFNIIDLIEVEDIVKVKDHDWIRVFNIDDKITLKSFIEDCEENNWTLMSIATKEMFQNIEYRLEE